MRTYIQSGNILFRSKKNDIAALTKMIEKGLSKKFSYDAQAVVLSFDQFKTSVASAPKKWGEDDSMKHNALFVIDGSTPKELRTLLPPVKEKIELLELGKHALFWSISKKDQTKTSYMKLPAHPVYKRVTIRNSNTTHKLLELFEEI